MRELILGGVRSGKSRVAEQRATQSGWPVSYIATAEPPDPRAGGDPELAARIDAHRRRRPPTWRTVEAADDLPGALRAEAGNGRLILVDCLTLWLSHLLMREDGGENEVLARGRDELLEAVDGCATPLVLVSNETGLGVMPANALARRFCDEAGSLHQALAERCERVTWTVAGLEHVLKDQGATT